LKLPAAIEDAEIESLDHEGRGVAHVGGKAVFVDGALPGESVRFRRTRRQRRYDEAAAVEVLRAAPERVIPRCRHFGVCGGCVLQHLDHAAQLTAKSRIVVEALERIGGVAPERWLPPLRGPAWSYRRRARLGCKFVDKKGRCSSASASAGARCSRTSRSVRCWRHRSVRSSPRSPRWSAASKYGAASLRSRSRSGTTVRPSCCACSRPPPADDLARLREFESQHGIALYLQRGGLDTVAALTPPQLRCDTSSTGYPPASSLHRPTSSRSTAS
jgi:23S rRNA (uracil1939-C5)-methyltransferase